MSDNTLSPVSAPASDSGTTTTIREWLSVVIVAIGAFAFVTTEFLPVGLLPRIAADLGVAQGTAGLMVTVPGIIAAIAAPGLVLAAGRMNRRYVFLLLTALLLASNVICALAPSFPVMLLGRALLGAALGGFWTLATAAAGRLVRQPDAARAMAVILTGVTCATVIGVPLGTFIAGLGSWRAAFAATAVLVAIALLAQAWFVPSLPSDKAMHVDNLMQLLRRPYARRCLMMVALFFCAHFCSYTYITPFLLRDGHFAMSDITMMLLAFGAIGFVSNFVASLAVKRSLSWSTAATVGLLMVTLLLLPLLRHSALSVIALVCAWGMAFGAIPLCGSLWSQRAAPDLPEAGSALLISTVQIAIALGSSTGGLIVDHAGISPDFVFGGVLALIALVALAKINRRENRMQAQWTPATPRLSPPAATGRVRPLNNI
jgi:predicted MFS family arabinose efflux permease